MAKNGDMILIYIYIHIYIYGYYIYIYIDIYRWMCSLMFLRRCSTTPKVIKVDGTSWNLMELNANTPGKQYKKLLNMVIAIVDLPIKHGDFSKFFVCLPGRVSCRLF